MPSFEFVERRNDLPHGVEAMAQPRLLDRFGEKIEPNAEASSECLRLITGVGVDDVVIGQQLPEDKDNDQRRTDDQYLRSAADGAVAQKDVRLSSEEGDDGCLAKAA